MSTGTQVQRTCSRASTAGASRIALPASAGTAEPERDADPARRRVDVDRLGQRTARANHGQQRVERPRQRVGVPQRGLDVDLQRLHGVQRASRAARAPRAPPGRVRDSAPPATRRARARRRRPECRPAATSGAIDGQPLQRVAGTAGSGLGGANLTPGTQVDERVGEQRRHQIGQQPDADDRRPQNSSADPSSRGASVMNAASPAIGSSVHTHAGPPQPPVERPARRRQQRRPVPARTGVAAAFVGEKARRVAIGAGADGDPVEHGKRGPHDGVACHRVRCPGRCTVSPVSEGASSGDWKRWRRDARERSSGGGSRSGLTVGAILVHLIPARTRP